MGSKRRRRGRRPLQPPEEEELEMCRLRRQGDKEARRWGAVPVAGSRCSLRHRQRSFALRGERGRAVAFGDEKAFQGGAARVAFPGGVACRFATALTPGCWRAALRAARGEREQWSERDRRRADDVGGAAAGLLFAALNHGHTCPPSGHAGSLVREENKALRTPSRPERIRPPLTSNNLCG